MKTIFKRIPLINVKGPQATETSGYLVQDYLKDVTPTGEGAVYSVRKGGL